MSTVANSRLVRKAVNCHLRILHDARMAGLVKLLCGIAADCEGQLRAANVDPDGRAQRAECSLTELLFSIRERLRNQTIGSGNLGQSLFAIHVTHILDFAIEQIANQRVDPRRVRKTISELRSNRCHSHSPRTPPGQLHSEMIDKRPQLCGHRRYRWP